MPFTTWQLQAVLESVLNFKINCLYFLLKGCLDIHNVAESVSSICHGVHFLLHPKVLYEIATFGLQEERNEVLSSVFISWYLVFISWYYYGALRLTWSLYYMVFLYMCRKSEGLKDQQKEECYVFQSFLTAIIENFICIFFYSVVKLI